MCRGLPGKATRAKPCSDTDKHSGFGRSNLVVAGCGLSAPAQAEPAAPAPSAAKLVRLTEFFQNEVATGKLAGVIVLIQQHGRPVYLKWFGVRDVATQPAAEHRAAAMMIARGPPCRGNCPIGCPVINGDDEMSDIRALRKAARVKTGTATREDLFREH